MYDSKEISFESLNNAIKQFDSKYTITKKEHLNKYDGLPTNQKLELLSKDKNLPKELHKNMGSKAKLYIRNIRYYSNRSRTNRNFKTNKVKKYKNCMLF